MKHNVKQLSPVAETAAPYPLLSPHEATDSCKREASPDDVLKNHEIMMHQTACRLLRSGASIHSLLLPPDLRLPYIL